MGLFSKTPAAGKLQAHRDRGFTGWVDGSGDAVMSRTDRKGRALGFSDKGWSGKGTPDEKRAAKAGKRK